MTTSWKKETRYYMWANYYSADGNWKVWDEDVKTGKFRWCKMVQAKVEIERHEWFVQNLKTGEVFKGFKTMKQAKEFAEKQGL